jgi:hypothetical protein
MSLESSTRDSIAGACESALASVRGFCLQSIEGPHAPAVVVAALSSYRAATVSIKHAGVPSCCPDTADAERH